MRLNHSKIPTGVVITSLLVFGLVARIEAAAGSECPCINAGAGVCVPDPACEARERQMRDRLSHERERSFAPHSDATMDYRPPTTAAPVARSGTVPTTLGPAPPPPASPPTGGGRTPSISITAPASRPVDAPARAQAQTPAADAGKATAQSDWVSNGGRLRILETGYSLLSELGKEEEGYGLYSYAILPSDTRRAEIFLTELFKEIPSIDQTSARRSQRNIFYVPLQKDREPDFATLMQTSSTNAGKMAEDYSRSFYDYRMARALLDHICDSPAGSIRRLCDGDLSRGPYIFTYASPASSMSSVPPPFLFVDLSNVHGLAFGEFLAAFRAQVKRDDITDQARIRTLRLMILDVALTAADWVNPVEKAIADIVHSPSDDDKKSF
jgi:hypothetical protein